MITLYQLHWSHFVEKVRWALDYKRLEWRAVEIEPFSKRQMKHLPTRTVLDSGAELQTVPAIYDDATGVAQGESSAILAYLDQQYPTPPLYPASTAERDVVERWVAWLDSVVGLAARRLAYTQLALEHPGYVGQLFVPRLVGQEDATSLRARVAGKIVAGVLAKRFRFDHIREDGVYEQLEQCLLFAARWLRSRPYLVGEQFTAADLTLAVLMRPTNIIPFFRNHPHLQSLFAWREALLREYRREPQYGYETALHALRQQRGWSLGSVSWLSNVKSESALTEVPRNLTARNDHRSVGRWPRLYGGLWYLQLRRTCGLDREPYSPTLAHTPAARHSSAS